MILYVLLSILCVLIAYFMYQYKKIHFKFELAGLKYCPGVPIFGNIWKTMFLRRHFIYDLKEVYDTFPDEKYVGFADGMVPVILVRDPELMKTLVIKDFDHFQNRKLFFPVRIDPLLGRNLLQLQDIVFYINLFCKDNKLLLILNEEWKTMRTQLTPAFTAARLRHMLPAIINVSQNIVNSLKNYSFQDVDLTNFMYRYTGDAIMSAAFGLDQESAGQEDSAISKFSSKMYISNWTRAFIFISVQMPNIGEFIKNVTGLQMFPKEYHEFVRKAVAESLAYREKHNLSIPDYMDVLLKISKGKSIDDLAGQVFFSYLANLESGSGTLRFCFHELALNPDIQERLYQEIRRHETPNMTLENISGMKYLECVLNETSRKWSAAVMMDRICTKPYFLPPPREGGKPYLVQPGDMVFNVVNPIQMDQKYFAKPEIFDPDRFSGDNKQNIKPFTFLPFGTGPRGCLGARLAILEIKVMIFYMVLNFRLVKCKRTSDPICLQPDEMNMKAIGGTWVRLEPRE